MNDVDFRNTLIKALELDSHQMKDKANVLSALLKSNIYIEYTSIFTRREWNTFCAFLHVQVPVESYEMMKRNEDKILSVAEKIFGRQGDHYLTDIETGIIVVNHEIIDFSGISVTDIISKAIEDAENFMSDGKYDSAFDRVHTAFHGYLRKKLDDLGETYEESDTLNQLYNKLHSYVGDSMPSDQSALMKTALRSAWLYVCKWYLRC